jgi:hypothetical protein
MVFVSHITGNREDLPGWFHYMVFLHRLYATKPQSALRQFPKLRLDFAYIVVSNSCWPTSDAEFHSAAQKWNCLKTLGEESLSQRKSRPNVSKHWQPARRASASRRDLLRSNVLIAGGQAVLMTWRTSIFTVAQGCGGGSRDRRLPDMDNAVDR